MLSYQVQMPLTRHRWTNGGSAWIESFTISWVMKYLEVAVVEKVVNGTPLQ